MCIHDFNYDFVPFSSSYHSVSVPLPLQYHYKKSTKLYSTNKLLILNTKFLLKQAR